MSQREMVMASHADIKVMKAVIDAGVPMTPSVVNAVWRWFQDVELAIPLPKLEMADAMRDALIKDIINEMDEAFTTLATKSEMSVSEFKALPEIGLVDSLWRELAGCYVDIINAGVQVLPDEEKPAAYEQALRVLIMTSGMDEDEVLQQIQTDPALRMMLRRNGLDPDAFPRGN